MSDQKTEQTVVDFGVQEIVSSKRNGSNLSNEDGDERGVRMAAFWALPENARLVQLGRILAPYGKQVARGDIIALPASLKVDGVVLEFAPGQKIALNTIASWGCPACGSAHGSGVYPSRSIDADNLAKNQFFYNPITKRVFAISDTCIDVYVPEGGAKSKRLIRATELPKPVALMATPKK